MSKRNKGSKKGKRPGRNDACPCGSGRKLKRCCGPATADAAALHEMDRQCVEDILRAVAGEFGPDVVRGWLEDMPGVADEPAYLQLHMPYVAYHATIDDGPRFLDWYLDAHGERLGVRERSWLESQQRSWLSIWEVHGVKRGAGLELKDVLTGESRYVHEVSGSQSLTLRAQICARIVDHAGISLLCGLHPASLTPSSAAEVVRAFRAESGGAPTSIEALRGEDSLLLLDLWEEEVEKRRRRPLPSLQNTDGDPLLPTTDHYVVRPGAEVVARLAALPGFEHEESEEESGVTLHWVRSNAGAGAELETTLLGSIRIVGEELVLETNSLARADALREQVERACAGLITHSDRKHVDLVAELTRSLASGSGGAALSPAGDTGLPAEVAAQVGRVERELKERYYASWPDLEIPALGGLSPREAARAGGRVREQLEVLLQDLEHMESKLPRESRFDVSRLRATLNMTL